MKHSVVSCKDELAQTRFELAATAMSQLKEKWCEVEEVLDLEGATPEELHVWLWGDGQHEGGLKGLLANNVGKFGLDLHYEPEPIFIEFKPTHFELTLEMRNYLSELKKRIEAELSTHTLPHSNRSCIMTVDVVKEKPVLQHINKSQLLKVALVCFEMDKGVRSEPSHWQVFLAAWKEKLTAKDMAKQNNWDARTTHHRLTIIERRIMGGHQVGTIAYDGSILMEVMMKLTA